MKSYIGMKNINAKPMTKAEYNDLRGWNMPDGEDPNEEGYLVEYVDSPNPNVEGYDGYVSWSPKSVFDGAYLEAGSNVMRHQYKQLSDAEIHHMGAVKDVGLYMHTLLEGMGDSRELSLAKTKIEEAVMWATKHITG